MKTMIDFQDARLGHLHHSDSVTDFAERSNMETVTLDFLRGNLKDGDVHRDGDIKIRKERVFEFFKSDRDVCKPCFRKSFPLQRKSGGGGPDVPLQQEVFANFTPFHLAVVFLAGMRDKESDKTKLIEILKQRMIEDKEFAQDALFTEVDNEDLFNKVSKTYFPHPRKYETESTVQPSYPWLGIFICQTKYFICKTKYLIFRTKYVICQTKYLIFRTNI